MRRCVRAVEVAESGAAFASAPVPSTGECLAPIPSCPPKPANQASSALAAQCEQNTGAHNLASPLSSTAQAHTALSVCVRARRGRAHKEPPYIGRQQRALHPRTLCACPARRHTPAACVCTTLASRGPLSLPLPTPSPQRSINAMMAPPSHTAVPSEVSIHLQHMRSPLCPSPSRMYTPIWMAHRAHSPCAAGENKHSQRALLLCALSNVILLLRKRNEPCKALAKYTRSRDEGAYVLNIWANTDTNSYTIESVRLTLGNRIERCRVMNSLH